MGDTSSKPGFPRWFLVSVGALLLTSVVTVGLSRLTGFGVSRVSEARVTASVAIWFDPQSDNSMLVRRSPDDATLAVLASDGGGFMRGVARSLLRQRQLNNTDKTLPFTLSQRDNQRFFILDPHSGAKMELDGFGPSNTLSVDRVLKAGLAMEKRFDRQAQSGAQERSGGGSN